MSDRPTLLEMHDQLQARVEALEMANERRAPRISRPCMHFLDPVHPPGSACRLYWLDERMTTSAGAVTCGGCRATVGWRTAMQAEGHLLVQKSRERAERRASAVTPVPGTLRLNGVVVTCSCCGQHHT